MTKQTLRTQYRFKQVFGNILLVLAVWNVPQSALADVNQKEINGIIQTREIALEALNTRDFSKIQPYLHPKFTITTVDNQVFHNVKDFEAYWNQQFSSSIKDIKMTLKIDNSRIFLSPETEVSYGEAISTFYFKDGNSAEMAMRLTAVMQKLQGKWTIQSVHFSSDLINNPVLHGTQKAGKVMAAATGIGGFVLGGLGMFLWHSQRKKTTEKV
jgi:ketosteroid isomerase-like protein